MADIAPCSDTVYLYSNHTFACQISGDGPNLYLMVSCVLLGMAPSPLIGWVLLDSEHAAWVEVVGFALALVIWIPGFFGGIFLAHWLEKRIRTLLGVELFSAANTLITLDQQGLYIEGLGLSSWAEVEQWQDYSDSHNYVLITTRRFGQIMLVEQPERFFAILAAGNKAVVSDGRSESDRSD
ncbi:MAG: hypothetical protein ABWY06_02865 [Pseudomonas sp.]|uniref:hypothetical protein n=1 Tax=Pseudomonas sp. TaxID=306 RepID=UPI003396EB89